MLYYSHRRRKSHVANPSSLDPHRFWSNILWWWSSCGSYILRSLKKITM